MQCQTLHRFVLSRKHSTSAAPTARFATEMVFSTPTSRRSILGDGVGTSLTLRHRSRSGA